MGSRRGQSGGARSGRNAETKACAVCGRGIDWRKTWERDWDSVRHCSKSCRSRRLTETDHALESAILELLDARARGASICPSEAAQRVNPDAWREQMESARMAARRLVERGQAEITEQGHEVDPSTARGPVRVRLREGGRS